MDLIAHVGLVSEMLSLNLWLLTFMLTTGSTHQVRETYTQKLSESKYRFHELYHVYKLDAIQRDPEARLRVEPILYQKYRQEKKAADLFVSEAILKQQYKRDLKYGFD